MSSSGKPVLRALLLADQVYQDRQTGKFVIAGTFDQIFVPDFPGTYGSTSLYINLGDFHGVHRITVRLVRMEDGLELGKVEGLEIRQDDRARHAEFRFPLPPMEFDRPGSYAIELLWDDQLIGECRIQVAASPSRPES